MPDLAFDRDPLVRALYGLVRVYTLAFQGLTIENSCPLPREGPALLVCNHVSGLDPFLLQTSTPRVIRWLIAKEYFDMPRTKGLATKLGYIPVARTGRDSASLKAALRALEDGQIVGVFPEGKINDGPGILPFQPGVAMLALRGNAPVVPAFVDVPRYRQMLYPFLDPQMTRVRFGLPLSVSGKIDEALKTLEAAVLSLERRPTRYVRDLRSLKWITQGLRYRTPME